MQEKTTKKDNKSLEIGLKTIYLKKIISLHYV